MSPDPHAFHEFARTKGLAAWQGNPPQGFTLAGDDGVFHPAEAIIEEPNFVVVSSPEVPAPKVVRYAWQNTPFEAKLINQARLPASSFELRDSTAPVPAY